MTDAQIRRAAKALERQSNMLLGAWIFAQFLGSLPHDLARGKRPGQDALDALLGAPDHD